MADVTFTSHRPEVMDAVQKAKRVALEIIGGNCEDYAKDLCPVRTGRLKNSITHEQYDEDTEIVGTNVEYAPFVELGTHGRPPVHYLRRAVENHRPEYQGIVERVFKRIR